jgi:hypothetical protein
MAMPVCTLCEQYEGVYMGTNLTNGDTVVACANCFTALALGMAASATEGMEQHEALEYAETLDTIYNNDPRAPKSDRLRPRRKTQAAAPAEAGPATDGSAALADSASATEPAEHPLDGPEPAPAVTVHLVPPCEQCGGTTATGDALKLVCNECGRTIATEPIQPKATV